MSRADANQYRNASINYLLENNYEFGFTSYWNANIVTALTNGEIEIGHISDIENCFFYPYGSVKDYYRKGYHEGKCFLLMTVEEYEINPRCKTLRNGKEVYRDEYFVIYDYPGVQELLDIVGISYYQE